MRAPPKVSAKSTGVSSHVLNTPSSVPACHKPHPPALLSNVEHDLAKVPAALLMPECGNDLLQRKMPIDYRAQAIGFDRSYQSCCCLRQPTVKPASAIAGQGPTLAAVGSHAAQDPDHGYVPSDAARQHGLMQSRWTPDLNDVVDAPSTGELSYTHAPLGI